MVKLSLLLFGVEKPISANTQACFRRPLQDNRGTNRDPSQGQTGQKGDWPVCPTVYPRKGSHLSQGRFLLLSRRPSCPKCSCLLVSLVRILTQPAIPESRGALILCIVSWTVFLLLPFLPSLLGHCRLRIAHSTASISLRSAELRATNHRDYKFVAKSDEKSITISGDGPSQLHIHNIELTSSGLQSQADVGKLHSMASSNCKILGDGPSDGHSLAFPDWVHDGMRTTTLQKCGVNFSPKFSTCYIFLDLGVRP